MTGALEFISYSLVLQTFSAIPNKILVIGFFDTFSNPKWYFVFYKLSVSMFIVKHFEYSYIN